MFNPEVDLFICRRKSQFWFSRAGRADILVAFLAQCYKIFRVIPPADTPGPEVVNSQ
jgi:hypothetical protein